MINAKIMPANLPAAAGSLDLNPSNSSGDTADSPNRMAGISSRSRNPMPNIFR